MFNVFKINFLYIFIKLVTWLGFCVHYCNFTSHYDWDVSFWCGGFYVFSSLWDCKLHGTLLWFLALWRKWLHLILCYRCGPSLHSSAPGIHCGFCDDAYSSVRFVSFRSMNIHLLSNNLGLFLLRAANLYESIQYSFSLLLVFQPVLICMNSFCLELYIVLVLLLLLTFVLTMQRELDFL